MRRWVWMAFLLLAAGPAWSRPPADRLAMLRHGVNITGWFRFPASRNPDVLAHWMSDAAMADLRWAGFNFVRLAVDPALLDASAERAVAVGAVCRFQRHGLAVVIGPHPNGWQLETSAADRDHLRAFWQALARDLRRCDPGMTVPEILNEPVFPHDPGGWAALQHSLLNDIRTELPDSTILLTGQDWGSIGGLLALTPERDPNVLYGFHFYDPAELTALAAYRPALDRAALALLPFPAADKTACEAIAAATADESTRDVMRYYCAFGWDGSAIAGRIETAASWARRHDAALLAGEFGATIALNQSARIGWLTAVRRSLDAAGIGWALWGYDDVMGFGVARPPVGRPVLDDNVLGALGLIHP